jgi:hypothetical protein
MKNAFLYLSFLASITKRTIGAPTKAEIGDTTIGVQ